MRFTLKHLTRLALLAIVAMLPQMASAHDFVVGGIYYNINGNNATVTYKGTSYNEYSDEYTGTVNIPSTVTYNGTTYSVTAIGSRAFSGCTGLTSVAIPNSVTSIGSSAFSGCTGLTSVNISNLAAWCNIDFIVNYNNDYVINSTSNPLSYAHNLYLNGNKVTNLVIPNLVTTIKPAAFYGCSGLTSVTIHNSVTSIGEGAFSGCSGLTSVTIPNSVISIGNEAFYGTPWYNNQPDGLVYAGMVAYKYKGTMPNGTSIILKDGCTGIASSCFYNCTSLTSMTIPNSVKTIGKFSFYKCSELTEVTIPDSLISIGGAAFVECEKLRTVRWNARNCYIESYHYSSEYYDEYYYKMGPPIGSYYSEYSSSPFFIEYKRAVYYNNIGQDEHYEWVKSDSITDFIFGDEVERIPPSLCKWLDQLSSVIIPSSVTYIGDYAFSAFNGLTSVYSKIRNPISVNYGENIFCHYDYDYEESGNVEIIEIVGELDVNVYVPHGKREVYEQTSPWNHFDIIEMDPTGDVNDDGKVNVTDYVATAGYILEMDPQPFYFEECDFNDSGTVSVSDLVGVATRVLSFEGAPMLAPAVGVTEEPSIAMAADVNGRDGSYEVTVNLSNNVDLTALQMDLNLPAGMTLASATLSDRASASHQVAFNQLSNGDYRLLASSPLCKSFTGNDGAVLTLTLAGEPCGNGIIRNLELATPRGASYMVDDIELHFVGTTGVENMTATVSRIYSDGSNIIIDSPVNGTAQIVLPNGISKTVTVTAGKNIFPAPTSGMVIVKMGDSVKKLQIK